jgi:hypothetical protein
LKKFFLLPLAGFIFLEYSCGQNPKSGTKEKLTIVDSSDKTSGIDSTRSIPKQIGWVNDFVHLFSKPETDSLTSLIDKYEEKTSVEFCVATIDSSIMGPIDFEPYTLLMFRKLKVGKKGKNNGILIVIAPGLKRIRIQNGYSRRNFPPVL